MRDENGWGSFVLTDINTTSAILDFVRLAPAYKIRPIVGIDFRNGMKQQFIGIAQNNNSFLQLNQFLTQHLYKKQNFPDKAPNLEDCVIIYPLKKYTGFPLKPWNMLVYVLMNYSVNLFVIANPSTPFSSSSYWDVPK